jgi:hypothetical protein
MLDSQRIYWNHPEWEVPARDNMSTELAELKSGVHNFYKLEDYWRGVEDE